MQKSVVKTVLTTFCDAKGESVPENQTVNGKCHKDVIKRLVARVHCNRPEVGPGIFCTTMHHHIVQALSPNLWQKEEHHVIPSILLPCFSTG
ncbi:hypothetical protein B7P43_G17033 [Cryptotermes secundus]|uniref:Uncharacterized protein n=1 Tax=Cryptotermes secundus TaxID=105785 RepID=A0A2J7PGL3_9NEOP|nr:hypothetical protein B7P43_G17033 [Cryptotermes secundus]